MGTSRRWIPGALIAVTMLGATGARAQKVPASDLDDSRGGQLVCRKGGAATQVEVAAGRLAEVRAMAERMGYSASECVFDPAPEVGGGPGTSVAGTVWSGTDSDGRFLTWRFLPGGTVNYTSPSGTFSNCVWQQRGARVTWDCNDHFADYEATLTGGRLVGTARNVRNRSWSYTLTQQGPPTEFPPVASVAGSVWSGTDSDGDHYVWRFLPGGGVNYTSPSGTFSSCAWQQQGARVTWNCNDHYSDYEATLSGDRLTGTARNVRNRTWTYSLTRQR